MFIQMSSYVDELLNDFELTECKPVKRLPYVPHASATSTQQFDDRSRYASLVGSLSYFAQMMRPDIILTVRLLAQHLNQSSLTHWRTGRDLQHCDSQSDQKKIWFACILRRLCSATRSKINYWIRIYARTKFDRLEEP